MNFNTLFVSSNLFIFNWSEYKYEYCVT